MIPVGRWAPRSRADEQEGAAIEMQNQKKRKEAWCKRGQKENPVSRDEIAKCKCVYFQSSDNFGSLVD